MHISPTVFFFLPHSYVLHYCPNCSALHILSIDSAADGRACRLRIKTLFHFLWITLGMGTSTRHRSESLFHSCTLPKVHLRFPASSVSPSRPSLVSRYKNPFLDFHPVSASVPQYLRILLSAGRQSPNLMA